MMVSGCALTFGRLHSAGTVLSVLSVCLWEFSTAMQLSILFYEEIQHFPFNTWKADYKDDLTVMRG